jgi:FkbM family methyltransferase
MRILESMKALLRAAGFDVVRFPAVPLLQRHLSDLIADQHINLVLDVGAYRGDFCEILRNKINYAGHICSFEPSLDSFAALANRMQHDKRWKGYRVGLSSKEGDAVLKVYGDRGDFNSLLSLRDRDASIYGVNGEPERQTVKLRRLDALWEEVAKPLSNPRALLKIDTQGHDCDVLLGATGSLNSVVAIQSELASMEIYDGMTPIHETLRLFRHLGYSPVGFYPVNQPNEYGGLVPEFDVLFLRR